MAVCAQNILTFFPDTYLKCQTSLHMNHNEFQSNITFILSVFLLDVTLLPGSQRPNAHIQWPPVSDKFSHVVSREIKLQIMRYCVKFIVSGTAFSTLPISGLGNLQAFHLENLRRPGCLKPLD